MRYDTPIFFQRTQPGEYDYKTGNYAEDTIVEVKRYASVTDTSTNTLLLVYGAVKQGSRTIRLQRAYTEPFDYIRIDNTRYRVDNERTISKNAQTFVVSEVQ